MARDTFENKDEMDVAAKPDGLGNALVIVTTIVLVIAFVMITQAAKNQYNAGMFGGETTTATKPESARGAFAAGGSRGGGRPFSFPGGSRALARLSPQAGAPPPTLEREGGEGANPVASREFGRVSASRAAAPGRVGGLTYPSAAP